MPSLQYVVDAGSLQLPAQVMSILRTRPKLEVTAACSEGSRDETCRLVRTSPGTTWRTGPGRTAVAVGTTWRTGPGRAAVAAGTTWRTGPGPAAVAAGTTWRTGPGPAAVAAGTTWRTGPGRAAVAAGTTWRTGPGRAAVAAGTTWRTGPGRAAVAAGTTWRTGPGRAAVAAGTTWRTGPGRAAVAAGTTWRTGPGRAAVAAGSRWWQLCVTRCRCASLCTSCRLFAKHRKSVSEGSGTEGGDHSRVARVLVHEDGEVYTDALGQLVKYAQVPGDEGALGRLAIHVLCC